MLSVLKEIYETKGEYIMNIRKRITILPDTIVVVLGSYHRKRRVATFSDSGNIVSAYIDKLTKKTDKIKCEHKKKVKKKIEAELIELDSLENQLQEIKEIVDASEKANLRLKRTKNDIENRISKIKKRIELEHDGEKLNEEIVDATLQQIISSYVIGVTKAAEKEKSNV